MKKLIRPSLLSLLVFFISSQPHLLAHSLAQAATLSLQEYLQQVAHDSPALKSSQETIQGSLSAAKESDLPYIPKFTALASHMLDERVNFNPFVGNYTQLDTFNFGFEKQFDFGLNAKLTYGLNNNYSSGISPLVYPGGILRYSQGQTELDLTQPLWRNLFGSETKANEKLTEASALQTHFAEKFKLKQLTSQAETAYYQLAIAREAIRLQQELLISSKKTLDWTVKRVSNQLTDKIDMLQAKASYQARQISLQTALDQARNAQLVFNTLRNITSSEVNENLSLISTDEIMSIQAPLKAEVTDDIKAAEQNERVAIASNEVAKQKDLPDLSLFASMATNGVNQYLSPAVSDSISTTHPMYSVGVKLSMPLYFAETAEMRSGRVKQQLAAEDLTRQKRLENIQTWNDLNKKLQEAKVRLKMADTLVQMQKEKIDHERYRFSLGRTTTYQVLMFEQDYSQALISRLLVEQEVVGLHSQLKTYAAESL